MVILWDAKTGQQVRRLQTPWSVIRCLRISPDGRRLAAVGMKENHLAPAPVGANQLAPDFAELRIWDVATGKLLHGVKTHRGGSFAMAFASAGAEIVTAGDEGTIRVWDAQTAKETRPVKKLAGFPQCLVCAPNGKSVVVGLRKGRLARFRIDEPEVSCITAHTSSIFSTAFLPDGSRFISASLDGSVKLWHSETGQEALVLPVDPDGVEALAVSPDGWTIATGGCSNRVTLWNARPRR